VTVYRIPDKLLSGAMSWQRCRVCAARGSGRAVLRACRSTTPGDEAAAPAGADCPPVTWCGTRSTTARAIRAIRLPPLGPFFSPAPGAEQLVRDLVLIVEILSPSTASFDRQAKVPDYRRIASVQEITADRLPQRLRRGAAPRRRALADRDRPRSGRDADPRLGRPRGANGRSLRGAGFRRLGNRHVGGIGHAHRLSRGWAAPRLCACPQPAAGWRRSARYPNRGPRAR
jgi:hypothetical protein